MKMLLHVCLRKIGLLYGLYVSSLSHVQRLFRHHPLGRVSQHLPKPYRLTECLQKTGSDNTIGALVATFCLNRICGVACAGPQAQNLKQQAERMVPGDGNDFALALLIDTLPLLACTFLSRVPPLPSQGRWCMPA